MKYWIKSGIKYFCYGISWGCTVLVFVCLTAYVLDEKTYLSLIMEDFARQAIGAMIVGVACGGTAIVYQFDHLSTMAKFLIHFGIGMVIFYMVALYLGWIPFYPGHILHTVLQLLISCGIFVGIWLCFYLFNHNDARKINKRLRELELKNPEDMENKIS